MTSTTLTKAKKTITSTIAEKLFEVVGKAWGKPLTKRAASSLIVQMSSDVLDVLLANPESTAALAELLEKQAKVPLASHKFISAVAESNDWLTTEQAAARMGFSRPYVVALFEAGEFGEEYTAKSHKGHRRVRGSAIDRWMREHSSAASARRGKAPVLGPDELSEFLEFPSGSLSPADMKALTQIEARKAESLAHRPKSKSA